jgi:tRNA (cmo5U34)-methyltransferase
MSKEEIRTRFDNETAAVYSQRDPAWLPEFAFAFDLVPRLVRPFARSGGRILDIGAGTGNLSRAVLRSIEGIHVTLMDFSGNMLAEVPRVLSEFPGKFAVINADFMTAGLGYREYTAVISSFAIHHCRGEGEYRNLYERISACLLRPGVFVSCDVVAGDTPWLSGENEEGWVTFLRAQGFRDLEVGKILSNYHVEDSPISLRRHMNLLHEAGFSAADVVWKKYNFGIYVGVMGEGG